MKRERVLGGARALEKGLQVIDQDAIEEILLRRAPLVGAPDELLMHPLVTVGLVLAAFAAVAFVMPAVQYRAPVAASGRQVSG